MSYSSNHPEANYSEAIWYLGIDFGTTGVAAVLLNYLTGKRYPLYWLYECSKELDQLPTLTSHSFDEPIFRLPIVAYSKSLTDRGSVEPPIASIIVGALASKLAKEQPGILVENFKPYLNIGIPYYCPKLHEWEPTLQLPSQQQVSLYWIRQALHSIFAELIPNITSTNTMKSVRAKGLETETLTTALQQLNGVILGCPAAWGDTYRFNLREAVLEAKLVKSTEQIFFLEDAIACLLAGLPSLGRQTNEEKDSTQSQDEQLPPTNDTPPDYASQTLNPWRGGTLVINAGATTTELGLVNLPDHLQDLTYNNFRLCSLPYAGNALDQDIFCQLLYSQLSVEQQQQLSLTSDLEFPQPGQPDTQKRDRLTLLLLRSTLGQALLKAASCLKIILQHKAEFSLDLGKQRCTLTQIELENSVVEPWIQFLNQTLNALLIDSRLSEQGIYQVLLLGGMGNLTWLATWIQQRLPNASIIRNTDLPKDNWVAAGLATLPMYPQVLNSLRQQYSDYFLLLELLRAFPETTGESANRLYSFEEIMLQLERRGLNTRACYEQLVRLVEGPLPDGLVPWVDEAMFLSPTSKQNSLYSKISPTTGLFSQQGDQLYRRNLQQQECLHHYLNLVFSKIYQRLEEPLSVSW